MQNIFLLGLQNNCFLTSQIRLSWKTKLLLLISHGPHAHMQHSGNLVGRILQEPGGVLGVSRLRLGVQSQPDHLESAGSQGQNAQSQGL